MQNLTTNGCPSNGNAGKRENGGAYATTLPHFHALTFLAACLLLTVGISGWCQESRDPLLDLMIQKGMLTQEEAAKVKAEADALRTNAADTAAISPVESKWKISNVIKSVELFGDIRFRYEARSASTLNGGEVALQRERYALRLGLRGDLLDDFYYGLRLETAANPRSPWATLGSSSSGTPYQGPFGKSTAGINLGQAYLGWRPANWVEVTVGKMPNPLYTTPMTWDTDLSPEGLVERFKHTVGQEELFVTFGQFIYQDTNPTHATAGLVPAFPQGQDSSIPFLLAWQAGFIHHFDPDVSMKAAATLYNYTTTGSDTSSSGGIPSGTPGFGGPFVGEGNGTGGNQPPSGFSNSDGFYYNQTGINDLLVLDFPMEVNFRVARLRARVFGDVAVNLEGTSRAQAAVAGAAANGLTLPLQSNQDKAYQIGLALGNGENLGLVYGSTVKKGMWEARAYWQHVEQYALDPNMLDSDFFEGRGNLEGIYSALAYGLTDNVFVTFRYGYASRIDNKLGTGGSNQDIPQVNPILRYHLLQLDLGLKF